MIVKIIYFMHKEDPLVEEELFIPFKSKEEELNLANMIMSDDDPTEDIGEAMLMNLLDEHHNFTQVLKKNNKTFIVFTTKSRSYTGVVEAIIVDKPLRA